MAIATCPKCTTKLKVPDGTTASVRCPKCQTVFKTSAPPAPAAPAAPQFEVVDKPASKPAAKPASPPPPPPPAKEESPFSNLDDDDRPRKKRSRDDDDEDDRPRKKRRDDDDEDDRPRSKKRNRDDDEDDERPRKKRRDDDEDEDDRPRNKKRTRDDEDDEDDRPRKKRRDRDDDDYDYSPPGKGSKLGLARIGVLLVLISLGLYAGSMALQALFILIAFVGGAIPSAMGLITGLLGLLNWVTGLVGLGMCIAGPSRARGLAIAAISVAAVHLILCFITANDSDSAPSNISIPLLSAMNRATNYLDLTKELSKEEQKNPGSDRAKKLREELKSMSEDLKDEGRALSGKSGNSMRWADFTTYLTYSDKFIAILSYESKGFSKSLLGIFSGLTELARLILVSLMLGSLAITAKDYGAQSKAKFGWIAAVSTGGGALLIMLLAFVIADNIKPDTKDLQPKMPPQPNMSGKSWEEIQRANEEYQKQMQAELDRVREKQESAAKAPLRWLGVGELLCLLLHVGSVAMPALAALAIYSGTGGGGGGRGRKRGRRDDDEDD